MAPTVPGAPPARPPQRVARKRARCTYTARLWARPLHPATRVMSVASRQDPIVDPAACRAPGAEHVEVDGSHSGLAHNRAVYVHLARFLATR